jgi:hypothetical protein
VNAYLGELSKLQSALNQGFEKEVMSFTLNNHNQIQASKVISILDVLEAKSKTLSDELLTKIKLVQLPDPSVTSENSEDGGKDGSVAIIRLMTGLLAHQVGIFEQPLKTKEVEVIRKAFAQTNRVNSIKTNYSQCLMLDKGI